MTLEEEIADLQAKNLMLENVLRMYADPHTYYATFISGDRPAGVINDDWGPHEDELLDPGDVRPGYAARQALKKYYEVEEIYDYQVNLDWLRDQGFLLTYYDKGFREEMIRRGVYTEED